MESTLVPLEEAEPCSTLILVRYGRSRYPSAAFTLLEVTLAIFILVFGLLFILALFPVGLAALGRSADNTFAGSVLQTAVSSLKLDGTIKTSAGYSVAETVKRIKYYQEDPSASPARPNVSGVISKVEKNKLTCKASGNASPGWGIDAWNWATVKVTSGAADGKIYKIKTNTADTLTCHDPANFTDDQVRPGDTFRILGGIWWPAPFFNNAGAAARTIDAHIGVVNPGMPSEYSFVAIISGWERGIPGLCRIDILVYRNFDNRLRPESNPPPIRHFVTYLGK